MKKVSVFQKGKLCVYCVSLSKGREVTETYIDVPSYITIGAVASIPALLYEVREWLSCDELDVTPFDRVSLRYISENGCILDFGFIKG